MSGTCSTCGGVNPSCNTSTPIVFTGGSTGATGAPGTGTPGADGIAGILNILDTGVVYQLNSPQVNTTLYTYSLATATHLSANGDKIRIICIFEVTAAAVGSAQITFGGSPLGMVYNIVAGNAKECKFDITINRVSATSEIVDFNLKETFSATGGVAGEIADPYSTITVGLAPGPVTINLVINLTAGGAACLTMRQFSIERCKII